MLTVNMHTAQRRRLTPTRSSGVVAPMRLAGRLSAVTDGRWPGHWTANDGMGAGWFEQLLPFTD
jgi:hypothetical protein